MPRPIKEKDPKTAKLVENLAAYIGSTRMLTKLIPDVTKHDLAEQGLYRAEWERGKELGRCKVHQTYLQLATSGKCWPATKHFLAIHSGMVEPKEAKPDTDDITTTRPDVMVRFIGKPIEVAPNENITESKDR